MYKVVFCGTPEFAVPALRAVHGDPDFQIELVLTQPDRPSGRGKKLKASEVKTAALALDLKVETPETLKNTDWPHVFKEKQYDLGIVVAYGQILSQDFLNSFRFGCVNIHSSLLPRWRGAAPMERAIMAGDAETGVSLQKVVKKLDAGDIIAEQRMSLPIEMGAAELYQTLSVKGAKLLSDPLKAFLKGEIDPEPQNVELVTHAKKITKEEAFIDWTQAAIEIHNRIRGLNRGGPFASTVFQGKTLKLHRSLPLQGVTGGKPGQIVLVEKDSFVVACGTEQLQIFDVQPESKAKMKAADFIRGYHLKKGDQFG